MRAVLVVVHPVRTHAGRGSDRGADHRAGGLAARVPGGPAGTHQRPPEPDRAVPAGRAQLRRSGGSPTPRAASWPRERWTRRWPRAFMPARPARTTRRPPRSGMLRTLGADPSACRPCTRPSPPGRGRCRAGLSLVTNLAGAGMTGEPLSHDDAGRRPHLRDGDGRTAGRGDRLAVTDLPPLTFGTAGSGAPCATAPTA